MNKKIAITIFSLLLLTIVIAVVYFSIYQQQQFVIQADLTTGETLKQDILCVSPEKVKVELHKIEKTSSNAQVIIVNFVNKNNFQFRVEDVDAGHYHPYEVHSCALYIIKELNFDYLHGKALPGYKREVWGYRYDGNGKKLAESDVFTVDPLERHLSIIKGYGGSSDYALVIKDLKTLKDALVLPVVDIIKKNPGVAGDVGFENGGWSSDGRYFWFSMTQTSEIVGFVRVDTSNWSYEIFQAPYRTMGGDAFNINNGMITYGEDVAPWSGVVEIDEQLQKEALLNRKISSFYVYNLFTKKKHLVATTTDPTYYFRPQWLSDTELQYELPSGEKKIYRIGE